MKVRNVMKKNVSVVMVGSSYEEAASIMYANGYSGLPVVDRRMNLVGIVSEKDLFRALYPRYDEIALRPDEFRDPRALESEIEKLRTSLVEEHMQRSVITIHPDADIMHAGGLMLAHGIHRLPVVEKGKLIGIVTRTEIYSLILERNLDLGSYRPASAVNA